MNFLSCAATKTGSALSGGYQVIRHDVSKGFHAVDSAFTRGDKRRKAREDANRSTIQTGLIVGGISIVAIAGAITASSIAG